MLSNTDHLAERSKKIEHIWYTQSSLAYNTDLQIQHNANAQVSVLMLHWETLGCWEDKDSIYFLDPENKAGIMRSKG